MTGQLVASDLELDLTRHASRPSHGRRGGPQPGSGRPGLPGGSATRSYKLTPRHVDALERYRQHHQLGSASEALRHLIESTMNAEGEPR